MRVLSGAACCDDELAETTASYVIAHRLTCAIWPLICALVGRDLSNEQRARERAGARQVIDWSRLHDLETQLLAQRARSQVSVSETSFI